MGRVALPEMRRAGYDGGLSTATLAAGGTLGILIPPSVVLVIYAILTEQNIATLFLAALVPGLLAAGGYMVAIALYVRVHPGSAGTRPRPSARDRWRALGGIWQVAGVFALVVGGIYGGLFSPTEGAAVGAAATGAIALAGGMRAPGFRAAILATAETTGMIFFILLGAAFYNAFLAYARVPQDLSEMIAGSGLGPYVVLVLVLALYLVLGCFMDSLSMILLTIPVFWPVISGLDFGLSAEETAIWFGVLVLIVVEVGLITPPVGMNLFVINGVDRETPISATWRAVLWFVASDLLRIVVLVVFPGIALFLL
jgi:tripartite ATP-independent transporter DctM subunit